MLADDKFFLRVVNGVQDRLNLVSNKFSTHESVTTLSRNSRQAAVATPGATALIEKAGEKDERKVRAYQVIEANGGEPPARIGHPIEVLARAYGL